jgi:AcrR family transcriptional regulator
MERKGKSMVKERIRERVVETKRHLILEEVSRILEREGFEELKMQELARRLGISVGALYKLFDSKESLYHAYIDFQIRRFHERLREECPSQTGPRKCLERYIRMKFDVFSTQRKAIEDPVVGDPLFFLKMSSRQKDPAQPIFDYLAGLFEALAQTTPLKESNPLKVAYLFNAFTTGYIEYWLRFEKELKASEAEVLSTFLEGMQA